MRAGYTRIWTDAEGESHFGDGDEPLDLADFAPPAPPLGVSRVRGASEARFIGAPAGWDSPAHPTPQRQYVVMLHGLCEATTSDGDVRVFAPGHVVLVEDTSGAGHRTRIPGDEDWLAMVVVLD